LEVAPPLVPVEELTRLASPSSILPEAVSEVLGISLSEVLDLYFGELDEVRRGLLIGDALDRRMLGEWDREWVEGEGGGILQKYSYIVRIMSFRIVKGFTIRDFCMFGVRKCKGHELSCKDDGKRRGGCHFYDTLRGGAHR
jgi:hypothetical protein